MLDANNRPMLCFWNLSKTTKLFTLNELIYEFIYRHWRNGCSSCGAVKEVFDGYGGFFHIGEEASYTKYVFGQFFLSQNTHTGFEDFVTILGELSRGTTNEKLQWAFNLYDINGDGYITKEEMLDIVTAIYSLMGRNTVPTLEENTTQDHVDRIFEKLDMNGDGVVTMEEFMEICTTDETIRNSMTILDTNFWPDGPAMTTSIT
ncbi:unnamed protein product, partial [Meganyctiphanes norvegica]